MKTTTIKIHHVLLSWLVFIFIQSPPVHANNMITLGAALDEIESRAHSILDDSTYVIDSSINNALLNVISSVQQLKIEYTDMLGTTINDLHGELKFTFENVNDLNNSIFNNIEKEHDKIDSSLESFALALSRTPLSNNEPLITRYDIPLVIDGQGNESVKIIARGINLNNKENKIELNGVEYRPSISDKELSFIIPAAKILDGEKSKVTYKKLKIITYYNKFFLENKKEYEFLIKTVPNKIGDVTFHYDSDQLAETIDEKSYSILSGWARNSNILGGRTYSTKEAIVNRSSGDTLIVPESIRSSWTEVSGENECSGKRSKAYITNKTSTSFLLTCQAATESNPNSDCRIRCDAYYNEKKKSKTTYKLDKSMSLEYLKPIEISLSNKFYNVSHISVNFFDGKTIIIKPGEYKNGIRFQKTENYVLVDIPS